MAEPRLDKAKPFITVFGEHTYAFKQGNKTFDVLGKFLGFEGDEPKAEVDASVEAETLMRMKIRQEIEAEMRAEAAAKKGKA